jgi:hypothetical protein
MGHPERHSKGVLIRDLLIFQGKLWIDGLKDVLFAPISVGAAILDIVRGPKPDGPRFYKVMRMGERFDLWLNLFGAAGVARTSREGLFAASEPGDGTMLGALEGIGAPPTGSEGKRLSSGGTERGRV